MRILFSTGFFPSKDHPFTSFIGDMAKAMATNGYEVTVIAPQSVTNIILRKGTFLPRFEEIPVESNGENIKHIKVYRPKVLTFGDGGKLIGKLTFFLRKEGCLRCLKKIKNQYDIVYAHFWECAYNVSDFVIRNKIPLVVVSGEDKIVLTKYLNSKQIIQLKSITQKVICVSNKNKIESLNCGLCESKDCEVIPNGADTTKFHPFPRHYARKLIDIDNSQFIISFVGRFIERKGAMRIIQALESLGDPNIKGIFIGKSFNDSSQEPKGSYVAYKGVVAHDDIPIYLSASDIYVLPTLAEGCSNSIVEAMACGLPIISSDLPFNYDILDSSNSILIDPRDINEIAEAIKRLKNDSSMRSKMSESSLIKAHNLNFDKRVEKILTILETVKNTWR